MERYAMYLRKSRFDNDYAELSLEETLKRHSTILDKIAQERGYYVTKTFYEVVSGESIAARPEIQKLLEEVSNGEYAGVLVVDVDRLARGNSVDQGIISQTFQYSKTKIITPSKIYDPLNEFDEEYFEFGLFMSRREYKMINKRLIRGRDSSASEGKFLGSTAPYGYKRIKLEKEKGYSLEIVPEEANNVRKMYEMYSNHNGSTKIANYFNDLHIYTRSGEPWSTVTIHYILSNPIYIGKIRRSYFKTQKTIRDGVVSKKKKPDKTGYHLYDGLHDPIISEELFNKVQEMYDNSPRKHRAKYSQQLQNPFVGLLYCARCGKRVARTSFNAGRYTPSIRARCINARICHNAGCDFTLLEEEIMSQIRIWFSNFKIQIETTGYSKEIQSLEEEKRQISKDIEKSKSQMERIFTLLEQGIYDTNTFQERREKLNSSIKEAEDRLALVQMQIERYEAANTTEATIVPTTQYLLDNYDALSTEEKNELLKKVIGRITYEKEPKGKVQLDIIPRLAYSLDDL